MKIKLIGSTVDTRFPQQQFAASYVINDRVAIDAGSIGFLSSLDEQRRIEHVFLSHSHLDHVGSLPIFLDNVYVPGPDYVSVYGNAETLRSLQTDFFNERVWPDLVRLSQEESPFVKLFPIAAGQQIEAAGLTFTAIALDHVVPTLGFVIEDEHASIAIISDTAPSAAVWDALRRLPRPLDALFLECAFPNRMRWLADKAKHLTPALFQQACQSLRPCPPVMAVHIKPSYREEIIGELAQLEGVTATIVECHHEYDF